MAGTLELGAGTRALPSLVALDAGMPTGCRYGRAEAADGLCTRAGLPTHVQVHAEAGGHHFDEGYRALAASLLRAREEEASRHQSRPRAS